MKYLLFISLICLAFACHTGARQPENTVVNSKDSVKTYDVAILDNQKDPVCGMPVSAGMEDTLHIRGRVIGFCSGECKSAFQKDPKSFPIVYK